MNNSLKKWLLGSVAVSVMASVLPATAQETQGNAATTQAGNGAEQYEEIVITARRRTESILKVPVVVNVVSAEKLDQFAVEDLSSISTLVPGLNIGGGVAAFGTQVSLRGVGTSTTNATSDQSVSLNIDGMQMSQGLSYAMGFFDMAQIEVLKGPQALFYGKASPAGVISIRSADPTNEFEAVVKGGYEIEAREKQVEFVLSGPVSDTLRLRLAASYSDAEGFFKNTGVPAENLVPTWGGLAPFAAAFGPLGSLGGADPMHSRVGDSQNTMVRATAIWEPSTDFKARLKLNYAKSDIEGPGYEGQMASCPEGTAPVNALGIRFMSPNEDCKLDRNVSTIAADPTAFIGVYNNGVSFGSTEQYFGTLDLSYNINPQLTLSSLTGYYNLEQQSTLNGSSSSYSGPPFMVQGDFSRDDFTQELRLTSDNEGPVNFMVGGFYHRGNMDYLVNLPTNQRLGELLGYAGALGAALGAGNFAALPGIMANSHGFQALPPSLAKGQHNIDTESVAGFGQLLWKLVPEVEFGVGARWTKETRHHKETNLLGAPTEINMLVPKLSTSTLSPEISLTYTPSEELTIFGTLKQAYKSGSFMTSGVYTATENASFGDERVRGGEIGTKGTLLDREVHFSLASYYYKYRGLQVSSNELRGDVIALYTRNAGGAKSYGVDFDATYTPREVDGLTLNGAVNWNISRFTDFANAPCFGGQTYSQGCNLIPQAAANAGQGGYTAQDLKGRPLVRAPKWSVNAGADYARPVGNDLTVRLGLATQYTSSYYTNILSTEAMRQDGFFKHSANLAISSEKGWELAVIGNNLANKIVTGNCINNNFTEGGFLMKSVSGTGGGAYPALPNPVGGEELQCMHDTGRSVMLRLTLKLQNMMK